MRKHVYFYFIVCLFITYTNCAKAQQEYGQVAINIGVAYSPEFEGAMAFNGDLYPVGLYPVIDQQEGYFYCSTIVPNIGGTIDVSLSKRYSIGIASNYQSEMVNWATSNLNPPALLDKISRLNIAGRFLYHLTNKNVHIDSYIGIRSGLSFWHDTPSPTNLIGDCSIPVTFINHPNSVVPSVQALFGMHFYLTTYLGAHFEVGIGSPYLAETGLTFRISTRKNVPQQDNNGGHAVNENKN